MDRMHTLESWVERTSKAPCVQAPSEYLAFLCNRSCGSPTDCFLYSEEYLETSTRYVAIFFFFAAIATTGASLRYLFPQPQYGFKRFASFWLPLTCLVSTLMWILCQLCIIFVPIACSDTLRSLSTFMWIIDLFDATSLSFAYFLRLRVVINSALKTKVIAPNIWWTHLFYLLSAVPTLYPVITIITILGLYDVFGTCGFLSPTRDAFFEFGVGTIFLSVNALMLQLVFLIVVLKHVQPDKTRQLMITSAALALNPIGNLTGAILSLVPNLDIKGGIIAYSFWLNDILVFLYFNNFLTTLLTEEEYTEISSSNNFE